MTTGPHLEKRFGLTAVKKGFITLEQLMTALKIQLKEDLDDLSRHRLLGEILIELGFMNTEQINKVLELIGIPADL